MPRFDNSILHFNGKPYQYGGVYPTKAQAEKLVKKLRDGGRSARVVCRDYVLGDKAYFIYWRKR